MRTSRGGFTLLEVTVASTVTALGALALMGSLAASAALAGDGRRLGRSAMILGSRADRLRAQVRATAPDCLVPPPGWEAHPEGLLERWTAAPRGRVVDVLIETRYVRGGLPSADTLATVIACP